MTLGVRPVREDDLPAADRLFRLAFGTFLGLPDPMQFAGDSNWVRPRWLLDRNAAFAADDGDTLAGVNFAARWGSVAFFGPLCVRPDHWDRGVGRRLLEPTMACIDAWAPRHAGLFTFAQSAKHVGLYGKFGFWPRALTAVMEKLVVARQVDGWSSVSALSPAERHARLADARQVTDAVFEGLDVTAEIRGGLEHGFADGVVLDGGDRVDGVALCHVGARSEAGSGRCYVKFAAVRPGRRAAADFDRLLHACEAFAASAGATTLVAGTSFAREGAYRALRAHGFRTDIQGVCMHRPNEPAYHHADAWVVDDWR